MSGRGKAPALMPESPDANGGWIAPLLLQYGAELGRETEFRLLAAAVQMLRGDLQREADWHTRLAGDVCQARAEAEQLRRELVDVRRELLLALRETARAGEGG